MLIAAFTIVLVGAYLLGSIPTGYLLGKARGIDVRSLGSGNIGATNVFRVLGKPAGVFVLLVDAVKGYVACTVLVHANVIGLGLPADTEMRESLALMAGVAAVLGHNFTCWLRFKGGKGIATSAGVLLALVPAGFLITLGTWLVVFAISRYVSLASIAAAVVLPFGVWATGQSVRMILICAALSVMAIYKHRANIQRLLNGTEHRLGARKSAATSESAS